MKKKIVNLMLLAATMMVASGAFVSCKDYCEDDINEIKGKLADQDAKLTNLINTQKTELQSQIKTLEDAQKACRENCESIKASLDDYLTKLEGLSKADAAATYVTLERYNSEYLNYQAADQLLQQAIDTAVNALKARDNQQSDSIATLAEQFLTLNGSVITVTATADEALALAKKARALAETDSTNIAGLNTALTNLQTTVNNLNLISWTDTEFTTVKAAAESAKATAEANKLIIDILRDSMNTVNQALQQLDGNFVEKVNKQGQDIDSLYAQTALARQKAEAYIAESTAAIQANASTINEVKQAFEQAQSSMGGDLSRLSTKIDNLQKQLVNYVDDLFSHLITGIIIQGTYNPVFGELALPLDARSQVLAAFFGEAPSQGIEFPTVRGRFYVDQEAIALTEEDLDRIGIDEVYTAEEGDILIDESEGNAGTLYFTVNPTSADLTFAQFSLVNSLDEEAPVNFTEAKLSDHLLSFGWTRAANNGFYETNVTIDASVASSLQPKLSLGTDQDDIKEKIKAVRKELKRRTAADLAASLFSLSGEVLPAYGLKTTWFDVNGPHSVLSSYSLAVTAIHPLSYAFLNDADYKTVPGYERLIDEINGIKSLQVQSRQDVRADIIAYVDRMNKLICDEVNNFNDYLQPTLLASYDNKVFRVVASEQGSVVKGSTVTLYPTSYSGEFLAPAFKKFVAVSNIYKNGVSVGDDTVREFNSKNFLNNVLPGKASTVKLNGLQSGCVYEIVYSAVDYSGKVVANKYYINVQ